MVKILCFFFFFINFAQHNGRSTDNVQPRWPFVQTNFSFAGHLDQARSSCYWVIFNILTSQTRDVTELKFLWPVNTTRNSPKFILSSWLRMQCKKVIYTVPLTLKLHAFLKIIMFMPNITTNHATIIMYLYKLPSTHFNYHYSLDSLL